VIVIGVVVANARLVAGGQTWADARYHAEVTPPRLAAAEAMHNGALPAWWDGAGLGEALAAAPSNGALYPAHWIATTTRGLDLVALLHLAWAALGVALWARRGSRVHATGASEPAAVVVGLLVATSGILVSCAVRGVLPAIAHLPWIGIASAWLVAAEDRRARARATIALAALLALTALAGVFGSLVDGIAIALVVAGRRPCARWLAVAIAAGLAIGSLQWWPAFLHLGATAGADVHGMPLARLVELVVPGTFGDPEHTVTAVAGDAPWAPSLYLGAPLLALAAVRTPAQRMLGLVIGLSILALVVGRGGWPIWLGAPELHVGALALVLAAHAGSGVDALIAGERRAVVSLAVAGGCTAIILGALGALRGQHPESATEIDRALLDGGLGIACLAGALALVWRWRGRATPLVLALLVLPSFGASWSTARMVDRARVDEPPPWAQIVRRAGTGETPTRIYRPAFMLDGPLTLEDSLATFAGTSAARWGLAVANSPSPGRHDDQDRAWLAAANEGGALLDRFGIELSILPASMVVPGGNFKEVSRRGRWALVEIPVAPPAATMHGWLWAGSTENALALTYPLGGGTGVLRGVTVLGGLRPDSRSKGDPPLPCEVERWDRGAIDLQCTARDTGYATVSSTAFAGWSVTVDGRDQPWLVADVLRRAVAIPAGTHAIRWRYATPGQATALVLAGIAIAGLLALWLAARRPSVGSVTTT
jgi:hypothetical protein